MNNKSTDAYKEVANTSSRDDGTYELACRASLGDNSALNELLTHPFFLEKVNALSVSLTKRFARNGASKDADELFGEICLQIYLKLPEFDGSSREDFYSWLCTLAGDSAKGLWAGDRDVPESYLTTDESKTNEKINEVLDQLSLDERRILERRVEGASFEEIAQDLNIPRSQVHRTWKMIRAAIRRRVEHGTRTNSSASLPETVIRSQDLEATFEEGLAEINHIRSRMQQTQLEIDHQRETTRNMIAELGF